ncbi:hypothetical protein AW14_01940 [Siansivirga zeaxanthinifaciens CC-SAMT-1]|uniref:Uncharacterized protein n=1 Tax=Siansivirga zeaxanthinifaciens CC-SAMT-1 TaxID=1454006 RepID=A0A0C5WET5_9FLAO|nr:hypothetical protein AW14_01940 [Siansivirga zeaxanthinifaciens CC-SAMT-1]
MKPNSSWIITDFSRKTYFNSNVPGGIFVFNTNSTNIDAKKTDVLYFGGGRWFDLQNTKSNQISISILCQLIFSNINDYL